MANIFLLNKEQQAIIELMEQAKGHDPVAEQELEAMLSQVIAKKGNALPMIFDAIEFLTMQIDYGMAKISEIQEAVSTKRSVVERLNAVAKDIMVTTGQDSFTIGTAVFKRRKLPARVEIIDEEAVGDEFKEMTLKLPLSIARSVAFQYDLELDEAKATIRKSDIKSIAKTSGVIAQGVDIVDDDFKVVVDGVADTDGSLEKRVKEKASKPKRGKKLDPSNEVSSEGEEEF